MQIQAKRDLTVSTLFINIDQLITFFRTKQWILHVL